MTAFNFLFQVFKEAKKLLQLSPVCAIDHCFSLALARLISHSRVVCRLYLLCCPKKMKHEKMNKCNYVIITQENVVETRCFNQVDFTWIKEPTRQSYHNCLEVEVHNHSLIHWENDTVKTVHCSKHTGLNIHRFWLENKLRECRIVHIGTLSSSRPGSSISFFFFFFWLT